MIKDFIICSTVGIVMVTAMLVICTLLITPTKLVLERIFRDRE